MNLINRSFYQMLARRLCLSLLIVLSSFICRSQQLYSKSFGSRSNHPIIFLHGCPGSSSVFFEATTAQLLADRGFYVIIYDRRGEGRSADKQARMDYSEAFEDLNNIYALHELKKASLLAFSFGGLIAAQFAEKHPEKVASLTLCSALVSQQKSYETILRSARRIYENKKDSVNLKEVSAIAKMDTNSLAYRTMVFKHASANGFFSLPMPNDHAKAIYDTYQTDSLITSYVKNEHAVATFWKHEPKHNIDVTPQLKYLQKLRIPVYALYGKQDGLYSNEQISEIGRIIGSDRVKYFDQCSHTLFIDQQELFLAALSKWLR
ncbi:alpha/beta hydrolase [Dyadobacter crusticola]|uniref:alpha/beta hydrolase n=1 Tax=Dyadobacter crusticola TaxID=292407 RepID=UPI00286DE93F|nr:alpha/beta hydrolase [Dyadobacter crusticola]